MTVDDAALDRLADLGVGRLILLPPRKAYNDLDLLLRFVEERPQAAAGAG